MFATVYVSPNTGKWKRARLAFEKALQVDVNHLPSRYHLGLVLHRQGMHEHAVRAFTIVLKAAPNSPTMRRSLPTSRASMCARAQLERTSVAHTASAALAVAA